MPDYNPEDTVEFVNIADRDFVGRYDGREYLIKAGERRQFRLPVAQHFAKHLADALLQEGYEREAKETKDPLKKSRARLWMDPERPLLYAKMIPEMAAELEALAPKAQALLDKRNATQGLQEPKKVEKKEAKE